MTTTKIRSSDQMIVDADFDALTHKITNVVDPTSNQEAATKKYVDDKLIAANAMAYKGVIDASTNPNYPASDAGDTYKISVAGKIGGVSGVSVSVGDLIIATTDGTAAGTQAGVGAFWDIIHSADATGSVTSSATSTLDRQIAIFDATTGLIIKNSLPTIDASGTITIPSGQSLKVGTSDAILHNVAGDVQQSAIGGALTIQAAAVTLAKMANMATASIIYRKTAGAGAPEVQTLITLKADLAFSLASADFLNQGTTTTVLHGNAAGNPSWSSIATNDIATAAVTLAKMADMATGSLIYRKTALAGVPEVQSLATLKTDLGLTGSNSGDQTITLSGDVSGTGTGAITTAIGAGKVTLAMQANIPAYTIMGNITAGVLAPIAMTVAQAKTLLAFTLAAADFANQGTTTTVLHGNAAGNPSWSAIATNDIANSAVTLAKMADMATASLIYRKTATSGAPEVNTLATLKTDLGLTGSNSGDQTITLSGDVSGTGTGAITTVIGAAKVTLAMMANMATGSLIYRKTAAAGVPEVQTLATLKTDLGLTGTNSGDQTITLTGDVTGSGVGSFAATIASSAVTLAKMANIATMTILGNNTGGSLAPIALTVSQVLTMLNVATGIHVTREVPTATSPTFTLAHTPIAGSEQVFLNGLLMQLTDDYTITGAVITAVGSSIPEAGDKYVVSYRW